MTVPSSHRWLNHAGQPERVALGQQQDWLIAQNLSRELDPYPSLLSISAGHQNLHHKMVMGTDGRGNFIYTDERRNLLMLGPARSDKTAGVLVPLILTAPGPVVSTSTKDHVLRATGLARARLGTVWHYGLDGSPPPPGTKPLRWSPIPPSRDWARAQELAKAIIDSSHMSSERGGTTDSGAFFANRAMAFIATILQAAALSGRPRQWVLRATAGNEKIIKEAVGVLKDALDPDAALAADSLQSIRHQDSRTKSAIYATAEVALSAYRLPGALRTTEDPNFDPAEFVAGKPDVTNFRSVRIEGRTSTDVIARIEKYQKKYQEWGSYDTVYITASAIQQSLVAPLVAGLLTQIREAVYAQHRVDEAQGNHGRPPVVWALDELASLPMRDLPQTLAESGSQGLLIAACLQDLGLVERGWNVKPQTFLTLFGDIVIHPGIRNSQTLEALSTVIGKDWVTVSCTTSNQGYLQRRQSSTQGRTQQSRAQEYLPVLDPSVISHGLGDHPDRVLHLRGGSWNWAFSMPYWKTPPWPQLLVGTMAYAGAQKISESRWELPPPELDRAGDGAALLDAGGPGLALRHSHAVHALDGFRERRRQHVIQK